MQRIVLGCVVVGISFALLGGPSHSQPPKDKYAEHIAPTGPRSSEEQQKLFHLPPGFAIQLVASEPEIKRPINIAFDSRGRLWVTMSEEYPFPAAGTGKTRDTVKILDDFQPDGRARNVTTFATDVNIPIGVLPEPDGGGAIVYSIPNIWRITDTNKTGKADAKEKLLGPFGFLDTHGMTGEFQIGFDGWVYACHGYSNTSTIKAKDGSSIEMQSGNTYRFKPDGSHIEYWTHGQVNPFGLAFDSMGNLFSCDCHTRPVMQLLRGGWYSSFSRPHDGLGFAPDMMTHDHGSTAIAGITYYTASHFPREYQDNVFVGNVVTNRINRDRLERHGSTYQAIEMPDFVKCDDPWFRPVDIRLGPDGALYVADFYTRIIGHYEVPLNHPLRDNQHGRIWRIVYTGKGGLPLGKLDNLTAYDDAKLFAALDDPNLITRLAATHLLANRDTDAIAAKAMKVLQTTESAVQTAHLYWVLERLHKLEEAELIVGFGHPDALVRVHAMRILADRKDLSEGMHELVVGGLTDLDAFVQRTSVEALATHPAPKNLPYLLEIRQKVPTADTHLLYAVRAALRENLRADSLWSPDGTLAVKLDKMADLRAVADVCPAIPHERAARFLAAHVTSYKEPPAVETSYVHHIARFGSSALVEELATFVRAQRSDNMPHLLNLLKALQKGRQESGQAAGKELSNLAVYVADRLTTSAKSGDIAAGLELIGSSRLQDFEHQVVQFASGRNNDAVRSAAFGALASLNGSKHVPLLAGILEDSKESATMREKAAAALAAINQPQARDALVKVLPSAPAKLELAIANALAGNKLGAEQLLDAVGAGKASPRLLLDAGLVNKVRQAKVPNFDNRLTALTKGLPSADAQLLKVIGARKAVFLKGPTSAADGALVFEKNCAACHQIANKGAKIGPQLDGIGIRGLDRILEDVLDPNRNVDQAFRTTSLTLNDGKIVSGLLLREEGAVLILADQQGKEMRVPADAVDQRMVVQQSPMAANFGDQIPETDFVNLLAYLLEQRVKN